MIHALDGGKQGVGKETVVKARFPLKKAACPGFGKPGDGDGKSIPPRPSRNEIVQ
jgi:hypothetical protein